jgi:hypothetical protein
VLAHWPKFLCQWPFILAKVSKCLDLDLLDTNPPNRTPWAPFPPTRTPSRSSNFGVPSASFSIVPFPIRFAFRSTKFRGVAECLRLPTPSLSRSRHSLVHSCTLVLSSRVVQPSSPSPSPAYKSRAGGELEGYEWDTLYLLFGDMSDRLHVRAEGRRLDGGCRPLPTNQIIQKHGL